MDDPDRPPPSALVGRSASVDLVRSFVTGVGRAGGALLLTGEPGVGKSVVLEVAVGTAAAAGFRVLRGGGAQFETEVGFSTLHQLLLPVRDGLDALADGPRDALAAALGLGGAASGGDTLAVSAAALALLHHAARQGPLLLAVDDAHWADRSSARVLAFVARRLAGSRIGLIAAARSGTDSLLAHAGLAHHDLRPLDEDAAAELLHRRFPVLNAPVRRRVLAEAQGNPLALLELPVTMTQAQRLAVEPLPAVLPLSSRLQLLFAERIRTLPPVTRRLLLLAALDGTGDLRVLDTAARRGTWLDSFAPAERDHLARVDLGARRVVFRHPLIGAAVVELATAAERRRAHTALAEVLVDDPERRAWHLAEAVVGADEEVASQLVLAAHRTLHRGDAVRAVQTLLKAAELSPHGADRARRLAAAAHLGADAAGRLRSVPEYLAQARSADPDAGTSLEVAVAAAYHLLNGEGDVATAHLVLVRAVENAIENSGDEAATGGTARDAIDEALYTLMLVCHFSGRDEPWRAFERALSRLGPGVRAVLSVSSSLYARPVRAGAAELDRLESLVAGLDTEVDPVHIVRVGIAAFYVDRLDGCREALRRVVRDGRGGGAATSAVNALLMLCHDAFLDGRWDEARRTAEEGVTWGRTLGYELIALPGLYCLALVAAVRGDEEATRTLTEEMTAWAAPRGVTMLEHFACRVRGLAALGRDDYEEAYRQATAISPAGQLVAHAPVALGMALDLVEAAVRSGRQADAEAHVAAVQQAEVFRLRPRLALIADGAAGVAASGPDPRRAEQHFDRALAVPDAALYPFEHARVQLAYGAHLRRTRAMHASRRQLTAALRTFTRLGARPWADRAEQELRVSGLTHRSATDGGAAPLSAQEYRIASLAASGLTNKQIATRLHLSPRTVSSHLYRVFPKLGIGTRAALRDALANTTAPEDRRPG